MKAVTWQGKRKISVDEVPDPVIQEPTDAIIKVSSAAICGSDLHLYEVMEPFMTKGDILGHEPMGTVVAVGDKVANLKVGDRIVVPFNISCGHCFMCERGLQSQCETTQIREENRGAALFGYSKLYGAVPGGQAEFLRVPHADYGAIKVPEGTPDDRFLYLSDVLPTAWQGVEYAEVPKGGSLLVMGLGPIGEMATRVARQRGIDKILAVEYVPERIARARKHGVDVIDMNKISDDDLLDAVKEKTNGRGPDSVIDAVGMEAHGSALAKFAQQAAGILPDAVAEPVFKTAGIDRLNSFHHAIDLVRRGGTISLSGVYAGQIDPIPMDTLFDKQVQIRMGQANVKRWIEDILPLLTDDDPFGVDDFATHHLAIDDAPHAYDIFQKKEDGAFKIILQP